MDCCEKDSGVRKMAKQRDGFSLMEVNLAILMVAVGLLSLFALFPAGLKESDAGIADTQEAMFADHVLSSLEGNSQNLINWTGWADPNAFITNLIKDVSYFASPADIGVELKGKFPESTDNDIRYKLNVDPVENTGSRRYRASLKVKHGSYGSFSDYAITYYTEFIYCGM